MGELKKKAVSSVVWSAIDRFSSQIVQLAIGIIIARILLPSDYGLIAMIGIFIAIAQNFVDSGFSSALIQKKNRTEVDYSTAFLSNIAISIIAYMILYFSAPYIASFYKIPELELITKIVCLNIVISALGVVQRARLTILLNFKLQAIISLASVIVSGIIAIIMAYKGFGVWALVVQSLISNVITILLLWILSKWKPILSFSKESFKSLFNFGYKLLLSGLLHTIYANLYTLVIGKKFSSDDAGLYSRASSLSQLPSFNITQVMARAIFPIQCDMQDDNEKLRLLFVSHLRMACYIVFPIMVGICAVAKPLVIILLTEKWLPMVPLLQILCIAYMWYPIMLINNQILNVKGRSDYFLKAEIIKKVIAFLILFITMPFGLKYLCYGLIIYSFIDIYVITRYSIKILNIGLFQQFKELFLIIILVFTMGGIAYGSTLIFKNTYMQLITGVFAGGFYFIAMSVVFKLKEFYTAINLIKIKL